MKDKIIILDDTERFQTEHREKLTRNQPWILDRFDVPTVSPVEFKDALEVLGRRYASKGEKDCDTKTFFDEAVILFVDYRLVELSLPFITGEEVAYLARAYSDCGIIVGLNQFGGGKSFDLTLCGHPESFADVNLSDTEIENPGLWNAGFGGFRPLHWPILPAAADAFEKRIEELPELDGKLFEFLGFTDEVVQSLPRSVLDSIVKKRKSKDVSSSTFIDFLKSGFCFKGGDSTCDRFKKRVIAARLAKWLDRLVLGGQNTLVDAPHLIARFPSLFDGDEFSTPKLNCLVDAAPPIKNAVIDKYRFPRSNWVARPAWFWEALKNDADISEVSNPWDRKEFPFRFCEDASAFFEEGEEFVASLPSPFNRRFVKRFEGVEYVPELRFAL